MNQLSRSLLCMLLVVATTSGCGYRLVKRSDVTARKFAADSAAMQTLERQIAAIREQCRADSVRMAAERTVVPAVVPNAAPAVIAVPDSLVKARDAEIASLKDLLAKANAELERIKRRLANPRS